MAAADGTLPLLRNPVNGEHELETSDSMPPSNTEARRLLTVLQTSQLLCCSEANVYALIDAGELPFVPIGRRKGYRIDSTDIDAFIERRKRCKVAVASKGSRPRLKHIRLP